MMTFDPAAARKSSWSAVARTGLRNNPNLPLLEPALTLQPIENIADRLLCMTAVAAHAFGLPLSSAEAWLKQEHILGAMSSRERAFLFGAEEQLLPAQMEVHGIYALAWCTSVVEHFSPNEQLPDDLVSRLPDLRTLEPSKQFRSRLTLRSSALILKQLDEAYCFHWAWRDAQLSGAQRTRGSNLLIVAERRKALEWIFRGGDWDRIPLDT